MCHLTVLILKKSNNFQYWVQTICTQKQSITIIIEEGGEGNIEIIPFVTELCPYFAVTIKA
jgi:hypothetical protein